MNRPYEIQVSTAGGQFDDPDWRPAGQSLSLPEARGIAARLAATGDYQMVGIFHGGDRPMRLNGCFYDRRDKSTWPIQGCAGLINSKPSDWF